MNMVHCDLGLDPDAFQDLVEEDKVARIYEYSNDIVLPIYDI